MRCPKCGCQDDKVIDSRSSREGTTIRRRRECLGCTHRFTTYEEVEHQPLMVLKRDGRREEFSREKVASGVRRACEKRPVGPEAIHDLVARVVDGISHEFEDEVPVGAIGERVMNGLRDLDKVAYIRFASIHRRFEEADDFVAAIHKLEQHRHDPATLRLPGI
jgi:transcriptional repressor NrdR